MDGPKLFRPRRNLNRSAGGDLPNPKRTALVTGITGQDGALLAHFLLDKGYSVFGATRAFDSTRMWRLKGLGIEEHPRLRLAGLDTSDLKSCIDAIELAQPDEIYNLSGLSIISRSFQEPLATARTMGLGAWNLLEAIRSTSPRSRFFQASTSEMFGMPTKLPQDEETPIAPRSPYASAKAFAHWATTNYRENFGLTASCGILYNHESSWRGDDFVTRKITLAVARITRGLQEHVELGNLDASRDWGYAPEYVDAMWRVLTMGSSGSYVIATGRLTSVRTFTEASFGAVGIDIDWQGKGFAEVGVNRANGKVVVKVSREFYRPENVSRLCGNPGKAERELNWKAKAGIEDICREMVEADIVRVTDT